MRGGEVGLATGGIAHTRVIFQSLSLPFPMRVEVQLHRCSEATHISYHISTTVHTRET